MATDPDAPLPPPPRPAHLRRGIRNLRRAYRSLVALIVIVLVAWAAIDVYHWPDLPLYQRFLDLGFGLAALIALAVWLQMERPLRRELKLARTGAVANAVLLKIGPPRGRRRIVTVAYSFATASGTAVQAECRLPRRFPVHRLAVGMNLEVLYDVKNPRLSRPRLAFGFIEFGAPIRKNPPAPSVR